MLQGAGSMAMMFSDRRLKKDIVELGMDENKGLMLYSYRYVWQPVNEWCVGYMADEVEKLYPEAVVEHESGFKMVNYGRLL
jgi:hypothetical protein